MPTTWALISPSRSGSFCRVKLAVSLLPLLAFVVLAGCNTANTRRDMYAPKRGEGYWTTRKEHGKEAAEATLTKTPPRDYKPPAPAAR
jgi:hypothetical protein